MTFGEIKTKVRKNLNDQGITFYTDQNISESVQEGYSLLARLSGSIEKQELIPQIYAPFWDFSTIFTDYLSLIGIFSLTRKRWLEPKWPKEIREIRYDWQKWRGTPIYMVPVDYRRTGLIPWPATDPPNQRIIVVYRAIADILQDAGIPQLPAQKHEMLEKYATADLCAMAKEFRLARQWAKQFGDDIPELRRLVRDKIRTDRIKVLEPYINFGHYAFIDGGDNEVWVENVTPTGLVNGVNAVFTLPSSPNPAVSLRLFKDGQLMYQGTAYSLSGPTVTFQPGYEPSAGSLLKVFYRVLS